MEFSVYWVLKGLPPLHLTLVAQICVLHTPDFSSSGCQAVTGVTCISVTELPARLERMDKLMCSKGCIKWCLFLPLISWFFWLTYLGLDFLGTVGIHYSVISAFQALSLSQGFLSSYHL